MSVDSCWCVVKVSLTDIATHSIFSCNFTHTVSSVSKHLSSVNITRCVDSWDWCFLISINFDTTTVEFKVKIFKTIQLRDTTDWKKGTIRNNFFTIIKFKGQLVVSFYNLRNPNRCHDLHTLLSKDFLKFKRYFLIHSRNNAVSHLNNSHFYTVWGINKTKLDTNDTTTHNSKWFRQFTQIKDIIWCHHKLWLNTRNIDTRYFWSSRKDDITSLDCFWANSNCLIWINLTKTVKNSDLVSLQKTLNTTSKGLNDRVLKVNCLIHIDSVVCWC